LHCRKHGISGATSYKRKTKYGGLDVSDTKRLRALEDENFKLKKLPAEAMLDNAMPRISRKKMVTPAAMARRQVRGGVSARPRQRLRGLRLDRPRLLNFYNSRRPHASLDGATPDQAYFIPRPLRMAA
jgi:hypothetical protein